MILRRKRPACIVQPAQASPHSKVMPPHPAMILTVMRPHSAMLLSICEAATSNTHQQPGTQHAQHHEPAYLVPKEGRASDVQHQHLSTAARLHPLRRPYAGLVDGAPEISCWVRGIHLVRVMKGSEFGVAS